jgi:hypothetical protein
LFGVWCLLFVVCCLLFVVWRLGFGVWCLIGLISSMSIILPFEPLERFKPLERFELILISHLYPK